MYISEDGVNFRSIFLNGLKNPNNYGGRILYVDSRERLYLGTANPFQGCEVWRTRDIEDFETKSCGKNHYQSLWEIWEILSEKYDIISKNMPEVLKFLPKEYYHRFI